MRKFFWSFIVLACLIAPVAAWSKALNNVWRMGTTGSLPAWGPVNLASANAVTGLLPGSNIVDNVALGGKHATLGSRDIVASANPTTNGWVMLRGNIASSGAINSGEGFTISHPSTGNYLITFTDTYADLPAVMCTINGTNLSPASYCMAITTTTGSVTILTLTSATSPGTLQNIGWAFIIAGQRT